MSHVTYTIVEHDGGWAYKAGDVFSETFRTPSSGSRGCGTSGAGAAGARGERPDRIARRDLSALIVHEARDVAMT